VAIATDVTGMTSITSAATPSGSGRFFAGGLILAH
jgi:hypothetical protein